MHCPTLEELPTPAPARTGWPWNQSSDRFAPTLPDGKAWPSLTIVTPSYNQGQFIEETIRSILLQGYPNLEYIVIDGGSDDETVDIIKKYEPWLTYWESEKDRGQAHAINKGLRRANGEIVAWLNSDDTYEMNALERVAQEFARHPQADVISGVCRLWAGQDDDEMTGPAHLNSYADFLRLSTQWSPGNRLVQPEVFFRKTAYDAADGLPEELFYALDVALWLRMARNGATFHSFPEHLANLRIHEQQKTAQNWSAVAELCRLSWSHLQRDWEFLGDDAPELADEIFRLMSRTAAIFESNLGETLNSKTYRAGKAVKKLRFW